MKYVLSSIGVVLGTILLLLGLLFLVGFGGHFYRLVIAALGITLGSISIGAGIWGWKRAQAHSPAQVRKDLLALAGRKSGRLTEADVVAAMPDRGQAAVDALHALVRAGHAVHAPTQGVMYFEFPDLRPTISIRRCSHCGWESPLSSQATVCAQCGGPLTLGQTTDDDAIGLDM